MFAYWVVGGFGFIWVVLLCLQMWLISTFFFALFPFCKRRRGEEGRYLMGMKRVKVGRKRKRLKERGRSMKKGVE